MKNKNKLEYSLIKAARAKAYAKAATEKIERRKQKSRCVMENKKVLYFNEKARASALVEEAYKNAQLAWETWGEAWATRESSEAEAWAAVVDAEAELVKAKLEADCE